LEEIHHNLFLDKVQ